MTSAEFQQVCASCCQIYDVISTSLFTCIFCYNTLVEHWIFITLHNWNQCKMVSLKVLQNILLFFCLITVSISVFFLGVGLFLYESEEPLIGLWRICTFEKSSMNLQETAARLAFVYRFNIFCFHICFQFVIDSQ